MYCPNCRTQVAEGFKFCPNCGCELPQITPAPAPKPTPAPAPAPAPAPETVPAPAAETPAETPGLVKVAFILSLVSAGLALLSTFFFLYTERNYYWGNNYYDYYPYVGLGVVIFVLLLLFLFPATLVLGLVGKRKGGKSKATLSIILSIVAVLHTLLFMVIWMIDDL